MGGGRSFAVGRRGRAHGGRGQSLAVRSVRSLSRQPAAGAVGREHSRGALASRNGLERLQRPAVIALRVSLRSEIHREERRAVVVAVHPRAVDVHSVQSARRGDVLSVGTRPVRRGGRSVGVRAVVLQPDDPGSGADDHARHGSDLARFGGGLRLLALAAEARLRRSRSGRNRARPGTAHQGNVDHPVRPVARAVVAVATVARLAVRLSLVSRTSLGQGRDPKRSPAF